MAEQQQQSPAEVDGSGSVPGGHPVWSSRWTFVLAATGSAVGLGNIWKFPYIAGENGGGAFVLVYLLCILHWHAIGWLGVIAGLMILSYYAVIAGWALNYIGKMASGAFQGASADQVAIIFADLLSDPKALILWQTVFMILTLLVVIGGVTRGLGVAVRILMPVLFVLLLILLVFGIQRGDFAQAVNFLFSFNYEALTWAGVLEAMGHAFFTLSLGMGAIMAYGAYMPEHARIGRTVLAVGFLDTVVALVAGLAIFPIVFANPSIAPGSGVAVCQPANRIWQYDGRIIIWQPVLCAGDFGRLELGDLADRTRRCLSHRIEKIYPYYRESAARWYCLGCWAGECFIL